MPACSSTCRGGESMRTSTTTPHTGTIGRQAPVGSIVSGVQGPAATSTAPAAQCSPPASTPRTPPPSTQGQACLPSWSSAPAVRARRANASVAAAGLTG